jgi:hypothetical protein
VRTLGLALPPAVAGGPLKLLNACLWLLAETQKRNQGDENWQAAILWDESLLQPQHRCLLLLDSHGNPIQLPYPSGPHLATEDRQRLIHVALDRMPGSAAALPSLERLVAPAETSYLQAAKELWSHLLASSQVQHLARKSGQVQPEFDHWLDLDQLPELVWICSRQLRLLDELNLSLADALQGEDYLLDLLLERPQNQIARALAKLDQSFEVGLANLKGAVQQESPSMLGGWSRLRRSGRKALKDFDRASRRHARNHRGIRGHRIHGLAQALRPLGEAQQDHIGLISAPALFRLSLDHLVEHTKVFHERGVQAQVVVNPESGICT